MTKQIPLSNGKRGATLVDDDDYAALSTYRWYVCSGYAICRKNGVKTYMHRMLLNAPDGMDVDHVNGDRLDNRQSNLRLCTRAQNTRNAKKRSHGRASPYKGVYFHTQSRKWGSRITVDGIRRSLGLFHTEREAALAYNAAARRLHGKFARLNEVQS